RYFEKDSKGDALPYLEAVTVTFIADKQSEFLEFVNGNVDFLSGVHSASKDELLTRTGDLNPKYRERVKMITGPYLNTEYLGILIDSVKNSTLADVRIRKAIGYGFDRRSMMLYLRSNMGYPAHQGFVPPGMPGFENSTSGFDYNPDLSRKLLVEAGFPNGKGLPPIKISTTDDYLDICEFIQHQLGELGIAINIEVLPGAAYREMMANSKLQMFRGSWVADYADPENYLSLFLTKNHSPQGPNYTHFSNSNYDKLYNQAMTMPDYAERLSIYQAMDSMVLSNAVVLPLYYDKVVRFVSAEVEGMTVNPMNLLVLKYVSKRD
ncbi:MAG TPA: ABC transporter substrate-binding protein, partial [Tenuifilaceae bacterium]|nr:ABC transporter substrate-binding protein [Tenuifilaceae bacterium]